MTTTTVTESPDQIRVLVVDDDRETGTLLEELLTNSGYAAKSLSDPTRTIEELKKRDYHLVLLDMMMEKLNGLEVLKLIRDFDDDLAVIVATGFPDVDTAVGSLKLAANDYIKKPVDPEDFIVTVRSVLKKKGFAPDAEALLHQRIGKLVREARMKQQLTLKQLAKRTKLSLSLLSQIERAESSASISSLFRLSSALNLRMRDLFGRN